ncbi:MAG: ribonuclease HII [Pseudomonadota bacterium]
MRREGPDFSFENAAFARGFAHVAGVDEAGRGPLAGPVMAAAVILDPSDIPAGLNDSKALSKKKREALFAEITTRARWAVGEASVAEIDEINILRASHLAMLRALAALGPVDLALIDGNMTPRDIPCPAEPIVKGDARSLSIAAASIVAKICRDRVMYDLAQHHPGYGWETNQGYPSKSHISALRHLGVSTHHRRTFRPVREML